MAWKSGVALTPWQLSDCRLCISHSPGRRAVLCGQAGLPVHRNLAFLFGLSRPSARLGQACRTCPTGTSIEKQSRDNASYAMTRLSRVSFVATSAGDALRSLRPAPAVATGQSWCSDLAFRSRHAFATFERLMHMRTPAPAVIHLRREQSELHAVAVRVHATYVARFADWTRHALWSLRAVNIVARLSSLAHVAAWTHQAKPARVTALS